MGKIFGISDLPVSTIDKAIKNTHLEPVKRYVVKGKPVTDIKNSNNQVPNVIAKSIIAMRNGFGKLMSHFSKSINNGNNK